MSDGDLPLKGRAGRIPALSALCVNEICTPCSSLPAPALTRLSCAALLLLASASAARGQKCHSTCVFGETEIGVGAGVLLLLLLVTKRPFVYHYTSYSPSKCF